MPNPLVTLSNPATIVNDFTAQLASKNKVFFVVIGDSAALGVFANQAAAGTSDWRWAMQVTAIAALYPTLLAMPTDSCVLPPAYDPSKVIAIAISTAGTICDVLDATQTDVGNVDAAFILAES